MNSNHNVSLVSVRHKIFHHWPTLFAHLNFNLGLDRKINHVLIGLGLIFNMFRSHASAVSPSLEFSKNPSHH